MVSDKGKYLSWPNFEQTYLAANELARVVVLDDPRCEILVDPLTTRLAMQIATSETPRAITVPKAISAKFVQIGGQLNLEISTDNRALYRAFYLFLQAVEDELVAGTTPASRALERSLSQYRFLLEEDGILSTEEITGLVGEILLLDRLIVANGPAAVSSWTGPLKEPHDFRFGLVELEIKSSTAPDDCHWIHGLKQLTPSPGCQLHLISYFLQDTGIGAGFSLPELVARVDHQLLADAGAKALFEARLDASKYREDHTQHYSRRYAFRSPPRKIPVDDTMSVISRAGLTRLLGNEAIRIVDVRYRLDVSGLGSDLSDAALDELLNLG